MDVAASPPTSGRHWFREPAIGKLRPTTEPLNAGERCSGMVLRCARRRVPRISAVSHGTRNRVLRTIAIPNCPQSGRPRIAATPDHTRDRMQQISAVPDRPGGRVPRTTATLIALALARLKTTKSGETERTEILACRVFRILIGNSALLKPAKNGKKNRNQMRVLSAAPLRHPRVDTNAHA